MTPPLLHPYCAPSADGYVRLPLHAFPMLAFEHVASGLDPELSVELRAEGLPADCAGFTEWRRAASPGFALLTIGWDWYRDPATGRCRIAWDDVRSNLMGVDRFGADIGMHATATALIACLDRFDWAAAVTGTLAAGSIPLAPGIRLSI
ncbi:MAG: DUF4902 domain-containing protein [Burkholderia gladioli]